MHTALVADVTVRNPMTNAIVHFVTKYYRDSKLSYGVNSKSLSHLILERYRDVTD